MSKSLYEVIGVSPNADVKEIEARCIELGKKYHPKSNPDDLDAAIIYKEVMLAYSTLRDSGRRAQYDATIKTSQPYTQPRDNTYKSSVNQDQNSKPYVAKRKVSLLLAVAVIFVPYIASWFLLRKGYSQTAKVLGMGWLIIVIFIYGSMSNKPVETGTQPTKTTQEQPLAKNEAEKTTTQPTAQPSSSGDKYAGKIDPSALYAYTKQGGFEKTINKYGSRLKDIERFRRIAAEKAIDSGKCDSVVTSELSDSKSSLKHLEFWVDCNNGERIYLDENQLKNGGEVITQKEKVIGEADAMNACIDGIKANASFPSSVDIHYLSGKTYYVAPTTSNVVLKMDFDAKNALGAELPYRAVCTFPAGGEPSIEIQQR